MERQIRIAGIGEILMDVFEDGTATVGGAPVNVAFHAHQLLHAMGRGTGEVVSAVGNDRWGRHILAALDEAGIGHAHVALNATRATGIANVFVRTAEAGFEILPDAAWDHLGYDRALDELAASCAAVAFGSLAQRTAGSGETIRRFVAAVPGNRLYDANLRQNTTDGVRGYSTEIVEQSCRVATIFKANSGEIDEIVELLGLPATAETGEARLWRQMETLGERYGLRAVVLTRGGQGALLLGEAGRIRLPDSTLPPEGIHPVGAGDAFSAGLLYGLTAGCTLAVSARLADRLASWVTGYAAATPRLTPEILAELRAIEAENVPGDAGL